MREGINIEVSAADREQLAAVVVDRNSPQKHVWRARIVLATAEGCGTAEVMRRAGVSKPCVWRWQERFMREGVAGLLHDKTRKPGCRHCRRRWSIGVALTGGAAGGGDALDGAAAAAVSRARARSAGGRRGARGGGGGGLGPGRGGGVSVGCSADIDDPAGAISADMA